MTPNKSRKRGAPNNVESPVCTVGVWLMAICDCICPGRRPGNTWNYEAPPERIDETLQCTYYGKLRGFALGPGGPGRMRPFSREPQKEIHKRKGEACNDKKTHREGRRKERRRLTWRGCFSEERQKRTLIRRRANETKSV